MKRLRGILGGILEKTSVNTKIISIAVFAELLAFIFIVIIVNVSLRSNTEYQESLIRFSREFALMKDISENYGKIHATSIETLLFWGNDSVTDKLSHDFDAAFAKVERDIVELERLLPPDSRQNEAVNKIYGYMYHLQSFRYTLPTLIRHREDWEKFFVKLQTDIAKPLSDNMTVALESLVGNIATEAIMKEANFNRNIRSAYIVIAVVFLLGTFYILLIINDIKSPLKDLMLTSERFARKDFKGMVPTPRTDELGILTNKFVAAAEHLEELYSQLDISNKNLQELNESLEALSNTDPLTGICNRRALEEYVSRTWNECVRAKQPLTIMYVDVDWFKKFNDAYGHLEGDKCLCAVVNCMRRFLKRSVDMLARWGGEEFAAVLPFSPGELILPIADKIRCAVEDLRIPHSGSEAGGYVTISIGVASRYPHRMGEARELLLLADQACYNSKRTGRNRITADLGDPAEQPPRPEAKPNPG